MIRKIGADGVASTVAGTVGNVGSTDGEGSRARFNYPQGVAVDVLTNVYVSDTFNHTIRKITPQGAVTTLAGKAGVVGANNGVGAAALFNFPEGLTVDAAGNVYVADYGNAAIRKITPGGTVTTVAGAGVAGSATAFAGPYGITVDASTNLYVTDSLNDTISKIAPDGKVTLLTGSANVEGSVDGSLAAALFDSPAGIAAGPLGNVYIADRGNNAIRMLVGGSPATAQPAIQIARSGLRIVLSWPSSASGYILEKSAKLGPGASWTSQTTGISQSGGLYSVTNNASGTDFFFRLRKP
jgi:hypothetical protein